MEHVARNDFFRHRGVGRSLVIAHVQTRMNRSGGAEENTWASCVHQATSGHEVHLYCGRSSDVDEYRGRNTSVMVHLVPELVRDVAPKDDLAAYRKLSELFATLRPDIVHTHTSKAGIVGRLAASNAKVPAIIHGVHILPFSNVGMAERLIYLSAEHAVAPMTDHFVHVSHGTRKAYGIAQIGNRRLHSVVRSGMDIEQFQTATPPDDWRELLGVGRFDEKPRTILMMAVLEERKRQYEYIKGFAETTRKGEDIRLLLAGDGPDAGRVRELIRTLDVGDRVKLLGHRPDPERLVALADVCSLASLREGLPRTIVQSLAGRRPAVVSPLRGIEEIVQNGSNGIVVRSKQAEPVARETVALLRDPARLAAMTRGAAAASVEDWKFPSMFAQLDRAYAETLAVPRVAARISALEQWRMQRESFSCA